MKNLIPFACSIVFYSSLATANTYAEPQSKKIPSCYKATYEVVSVVLKHSQDIPKNAKLIIKKTDVDTDSGEEKWEATVKGSDFSLSPYTVYAIPYKNKCHIRYFSQENAG